MTGQTGDGKFRIAFYGFAERDAGSVSSAGYVILRELLDRKHQIDYFGKRSFAFPAGLDAYPNFRFINTERPLERWLGRACNFRNGLLIKIAGPLTAGQTYRNVPIALRAEHQSHLYDVCLYFGTWAFDRIDTLPMISWVQGPPGTDSRSIKQQGKLLRRLEGTFRYVMLRLFAKYRDTVGRPAFKHSDAVICGSAWAADDLRPFLGPTVPITALPYPIDLKTFIPEAKTENAVDRPMVLWAGRSVPRKRLDLFLDACACLLDAGRDIDVRVIGGFSFAPEYRRLIEEFRYPQRLQYSATIPREQMPALYRRATVLVQPSEDENFGSAVAEALACGTPVVVGPTNGTGDYVSHAGFPFATYEAASVASGIESALNSCDADAANLARSARTIAEQNFDVRSVVTKLEIFISRMSKTKLVAKASPPFSAETSLQKLNEAPVNSVA